MFSSKHYINLSSTLVNLEKILNWQLSDQERINITALIDKLKGIESKHKKTPIPGYSSYGRMVEDFKKAYNSLLREIRQDLTELSLPEIQSPSEGYKWANDWLQNAKKAIQTNQLQLSDSLNYIDMQILEFSILAVSNRGNYTPMPQRFSLLQGMELAKRKHHNPTLNPSDFSKPGGHCHGVVMYWAKSIATKKVERQYHLMNSYTLYQQEHQVNLLLSQHKFPLGSPLSFHSTSRNLIRDLGSEKIYSLTISGKSFFHALGVRKVRGSRQIEIIDPNIGLFSADSQLDAAQLLAGILMYYSRKIPLKSLAFHPLRFNNSNQLSHETLLNQERGVLDCLRDEIQALQHPHCFTYEHQEFLMGLSISYAEANLPGADFLQPYIEEIETRRDEIKLDTELAQNKFVVLNGLANLLKSCQNWQQVRGALFNWAGNNSNYLYNNFDEPLSNYQCLSIHRSFHAKTETASLAIVEKLWRLASENHPVETVSISV